MKYPALKLGCAALALLSLTACELRREGGADPQEEAEPQSERSPPAEESQVDEGPATEASETPAASIFRDEALPDEDEEEPPEALAITVPFPDGGNAIEGAALSALQQVLESDALREGWPVTLRGHTDSSGNDSANLRASRARAEAVAAWLVERGVDDGRITVIAFGEQNPLAPNARPDGSPDEEGRASNRRVDIDIAPIALQAESSGQEGDDEA